MAEATALERVSALVGGDGAGAGGVGAAADAGAAEVILGEIGDLALHQIAAWPDRIDAVGEIAARAAGVAAAPGPGRAVQAAESAAINSAAATDATSAESAKSTESKSPPPALLRIEPLKWWLIGAAAPDIGPQQGAVLDLSHARTRLRIAGPRAAEFLNRHLPLDLRAAAFPEGAVASSQLHHVGVTLWRSRRGYELFIPRGYALSVWEVLLQTAAQFDAVTPPAESHTIAAPNDTRAP
ncbi:MAG: hypothetical protein OXU71_04540 [Gammaproteobacteria bacterium]|nr:hypothetical protein [Gammaproteobacteria bacterium]